MSCSTILACALMLLAVALAIVGCGEPERVLPLGQGAAGHPAFVCDAQVCGLGGEPREAIETCGRGNINSECRCVRPYCCHWQWECTDAR